MVMFGTCSFPAMRRRFARLVLLAMLLFSASAVAQENTPEALTISRADRLKVFEEVWEAVNKHFFDPNFNGVNWAQVREQYRPQAEAAPNKTQLNETLQKMLNELRSSHLTMTVHVKFKKQTVEQELARKVSRRESLTFDAGMKYVRIDGKWVVSSVAEGSGAHSAGVQRGWALTHWNGESSGNDAPFTCELNQQVTARFLDWQGQEKQLALACKLYTDTGSPVERVTQTLADGTVCLRFDNFSPGTESWLIGQVAQARNAPALVLDLRNNHGGNLSVLEKCFAPFFSEPRVFGAYHERNGKQLPLKAKGQGKDAYRGRVVVLIDEKTASAAEIFAAGLQEAKRAVIVGRQSSGDVLGSLNYKLPHGFYVDIPIWDYQTANGARLEGRGVIPNEVVTLTLKDFLANRDLDLLRAQESLLKP